MKSRGHAATLQEVSAKQLLRFVAQHHFDDKWLTARNKDIDVDDEKENQGSENTNKKKRRPGSGGAWRAFCSEWKTKSKDAKYFTKQLAREYRELSADDREYYKTLGRQMTLQGQYARYKARVGGEIESAVKPKTDKREMSVFHPPPLHSVSDVLAVSDPPMMLEGYCFEDKLAQFKKLVNAEQLEHLSRKRESHSPSDPTKTVQDAVPQDALVRYGGQGFSMVYAMCLILSSYNNINGDFPLLLFVQDTRVIHHASMKQV